jgi:hypothetical protein
MSFSTTSHRIGAVPRIAALALVACAGLLLALFATAGPAGAGTINSVSPSTNLASTQTVTVTATFASGDATYAIAECNTAYANGTACNALTALGSPSPVPSGTGPHTFTLTVNRTFANTDFTGAGGPGGTTTCKAAAGGKQCAVFLSTYDSAGNHLNRDTLANITFRA